jgi:hypothetical protein
VMVCDFDATYSRGWCRRIAVGGQLQAKSWDPIWKVN